MNAKASKLFHITILSSRSIRNLSVSSVNHDSYKLVIVGGGAGGISTAAKFSRRIGAQHIAVVEPSKTHYYQPGWTLVGGGLKTADDVKRDQKDCMPKGVHWLQTKAADFDPQNNTVTLEGGKKIKYDFLVVSTGIETNFKAIKGLNEALEHDDKVVSNYSPKYVKKTYPAINSVKEGNAIFTFPQGVIKCPGAPQKIMYMADDCFRRNGVRDKVTVMYNTALPVIFGVKKYAAQLMKVATEKNIQLNFRTVLVEVDHEKNEAKFEKLDAPGTFVNYNYSMLHVGPPMKPFDFIKQSELADGVGFVDIDKETLQHKKFKNVFAIGDCTNAPTSKTAAAVAAQSAILATNLSLVMKGQPPIPKYDGYTSCPLITGYGKTILAEFDFNGNPLETFPFDQGEERRSMYHLKKDLMPAFYWQGILKGIWNGPEMYRKMLSPLKR